MYKKESSIGKVYKKRYEEEKNKSNYFEIITDFISDEKLKEDDKDDIRRTVIAEIKRIEIQQQQIHSRIETARPRFDRNREKTNSLGERIRRTSRVLFSNLRNFTRDFFTTKSFKREIEKQESFDIKKIEIKEQTEQTRERTHEQRRSLKI